MLQTNPNLNQLIMSLVINEIRSISPSKYHKFTQCQLTELWSLSKNKSLIPTNADALLGTIIHNIYERFCIDSELQMNRFEEVWYEIETDILGKQVFNNQPDIERYKPLNITSKYYSPKKFNTKIAVEKIISARGNDPLGKSITEQGLNSISGRIYGKIDLLIKNKQTNEVTLIDYKTGSIHDEDGKIKMDYILQLKIYAALYNQNHEKIFDGVNEWPDYLMLIDNVGNKHIIEYTHQETKNIIEEIESTINKTNNIIQQNTINLEDHFAVTGLHCNYCNFRPACKKYLASDDKKKDIVAVIKSIRLIKESGKWVISFEEKDTEMEIEKEIKKENSLHYYLLTDSDRNIDVKDLVGKKCIFTNIKFQQNQAYDISTRFSIFQILDIQN